MSGGRLGLQCHEQAPRAPFSAVVERTRGVHAFQMIVIEERVVASKWRFEATTQLSRLPRLYYIPLTTAHLQLGLQHTHDG